MKKLKKETVEEKLDRIDAWDWFGLSYASWLVVPRIALQSMPDEWQDSFFSLLEELFDKVQFPKGYKELDFVVTAKRGNRFVSHILPHYRHNNLELVK